MGLEAGGGSPRPGTCPASCPAAAGWRLGMAASLLYGSSSHINKQRESATQSGPVTSARGRSCVEELICLHSAWLPVQAAKHSNLRNSLLVIAIFINPSATILIGLNLAQRKLAQECPRSWPGDKIQTCHDFGQHRTDLSLRPRLCMLSLLN